MLQMNTMERRLRANGEKEETIAKYKDVDAYLKRLEKKLKEGSTLDVGLKGNNKVSSLASQLSSKLTHVGGAAAPQKSKPVSSVPTQNIMICHSFQVFHLLLFFYILVFSLFTGYLKLNLCLLKFEW